MNDRRGSNENAGTWLALTGLVIIAVFLFGLVALVLPKFVFLIIVLACFVCVGALQYIILGWWFSGKSRDGQSHDEEEQDDPE